MFVLLILLLQLQHATSAPLDLVTHTLEGAFTFDSSLKCAPINSVKVPTKVDHCTKDLFIYYSCNGTETTGFFTKDNEIVPISKPDSCNDTIMTFFDNNILSVKKLSNFVIFEFKNNFWIKLLVFLAKSFDDANDFAYLGFLFFIIVVFVSIIVLLLLKVHSLTQNLNRSDNAELGIVIPADNQPHKKPKTSAEKQIDRTTRKKANKNQPKHAAKESDRVIFCIRRKQCRTLACPCKAAGLECTEFCHKGTTCHNK